MIDLHAPETIDNGAPLHVRFEAEGRVSGRLRLTAGTEALEFTLLREGRDPVRGTDPRVRGRSGELVLTEWAEQPVGSEIVVRFEGAKRFVRVT
jgi:hypothetical protein